jgi:hypothetical protein
MAETIDAQIVALEQIVRQGLERFVEGFDNTLGSNIDLQLAGVGSLDLIVTLSTIEEELGISLESAFTQEGASFIAKGFTIASIARLLHSVKYS